MIDEGPRIEGPESELGAGTDSAPPEPIAHEDLKRTLDELIDLDPIARDQRLATLRASAPDLAQELTELLAASDEAEASFLVPAVEAQLPAPARSPEEIGPYRVIDVLGRGGMATVYRAAQTEPIAREVAVKVVRGELASPSILKRFEAERLVLSRLEHPNVARVLDAGAEPYGPAYFVMELVDGPPLTDYAIRENLPLSRRIRLAIEVCKGVQHAHTRGVLHRDLKPSNLLVAESDDGPVPKVIDFGVAKALGREGRLPETQLTHTGQLIGTLEYMSPEQAGFGSGEVDARSDVFSMGVVLYELIADARPLDLEGRSVSGISRFLRSLETQDPEAPSQRNRCSLPVDLSRAAVADLDCVVRRALERSPERRYQTIAELADDLERVLDGAPVEARPPTRMYLLTRYARRHRALAASLSGVVVALFLGVLGTSFGLLRAIEHSEQADAARAESEQVADFLQGMLLDARTEGAGPETPYIDVVARAGQRVLADERLEQAVRGRIAASLGSSLFDANRPSEALPLLELADANLRDADPVHVAHRAGSLRRLALIAIDEGRTDDARARLQLARELHLQLADSADQTGELIEIEGTLASLVADGGDAMAAAALERSVLERAIELDDQDNRVASLRSSLAMTLLSIGDAAGAEEQARASLAFRREHYKPQDFRNINVGRVLADAVAHQGRVDEALAIMEELHAQADLGADDPRGLLLDLSLAGLRYRATQEDDDARAYAQAIDRAVEQYGAETRTGAVLGLRAIGITADRSTQEALSLADEQIALLERELGTEHHPDLTRAALTAGRELHRAGAIEAARPYLERARAGLLASNTGTPPMVATIDQMLATGP